MTTPNEPGPSKWNRAHSIFKFVVFAIVALMILVVIGFAGVMVWCVLNIHATRN